MQTVDFGNGNEDPQPFGMGGMTLRDYFAGQAMNGGLSSEDGHHGCIYMDTEEMTREDFIAKEAYKVADAMIKERNKGAQQMSATTENLNARTDRDQWISTDKALPVVNGECRALIVFCGEIWVHFHNGSFYWQNGEEIATGLVRWWK
ncbi:hypothetical protein [Oceanispirochaeta sp.]|uniref:hypothetical protein n=1 Tax=Oceanispirochaeta sp. TaxID=2035350 RepID=UPI0026060EF2|nr:hypothetical protein [Oceanispirochaeta sp.]MDA3957333.1 hypothetical protein [Oceanispirochaeta sp.]